jgi:hypothetical protein
MRHQMTAMYGAESARKALQDIVDKSLGSGITRVVVSPIANKRVQLVVGEPLVGLVTSFSRHPGLM